MRLGISKSNIETTDLRGEYERARSLGFSNPSAALKEMEGLAQRGSRLAMAYIADALLIGRFYRQDLEKAEIWYRAVAEWGLARGIHGLGMVFREKGDFGSAAEEFGRAVSMNYGPSFNMLGLQYYRGDGVEMDLDKARDLFERGMKIGHFHSKRRLSWMLRGGKYGVLQTARGWLLWFWSFLDALWIVMFDQFGDRARQ